MSKNIFINKAICKSWNRKSGNGMREMMEIREIWVGMLGIPGIWVRMQRIGVGMPGICVGMRGI